MDDDGYPVIMDIGRLGPHSNHDITPIHISRRPATFLRFSPASRLPSDAPSKDPQTSVGLPVTIKGLEKHHRNHHHHHHHHHNNKDKNNSNNNNNNNNKDKNNSNNNNNNNKDTFMMK